MAHDARSRKTQCDFLLICCDKLSLCQYFDMDGGKQKISRARAVVSTSTKRRRKTALEKLLLWSRKHRKSMGLVDIKAIFDIAVKLYPWLMQDMINRHINRKNRDRDVDMSINHYVGIFNVVNYPTKAMRKCLQKIQSQYYVINCV